MIPVAIKPIVQTGHDCAIAALAMFTDRPYAEVATVVVEIAPKAFTRGMWATEIQRAAKRLGVILKQTRRFNVDADSGLLCVHEQVMGAHVVVLFHGVIMNPADGKSWKPAAYFSYAKAKPRVLLRP